MTTAKLATKVKKDKFLEQILFLLNMIGTYTKSLKIESNRFYSSILRYMKQDSVLRRASFDKNGVSDFENILSAYKKAKDMESEGIYTAAPFLNSLSKLLSEIYKEASLNLGEEMAKKFLLNSFHMAKKKNSKVPNLRGYVPGELIGKSERVSGEMYSVILMDNMITYLVHNFLMQKKVRVQRTKQKEGDDVSSNTKKG